MAKIENLLVLTSLIAFIAFSGSAFAQDDLDDLLKDLESDAVETTTMPKAETPEEVPASTEEPQSEAATSAAPAAAPAEEKPAVAEQKPVETIKESVAENTAPAPSTVTEALQPATSATDGEPAKKTEQAAAAEAEKPVVTKVDSVLNLLDELAAEDNVEPTSATADVAQAKMPAAAAPANPDAELLANIRATEKLRRQAYDAQAHREIDEARRAMSEEDYAAAVRHYGNAVKLLNERTVSAGLRRECEQGVAEGLYRAALQEDRTGRRARALKLMEKAIDMRHPRARSQYEEWVKEGDPLKEVVDVAAISHRRNDADFKAKREKTLRHLKRARQYLATRELDKALDECELVLVSDPYNQEAIRVRNAIQKKRRTILKQERAATREGMIADVDEAWRPVYAVDAREIADATAQTLKSQTGEDSERSVEQSIIKRMKEMRLPSISFKPPATIIDAVEFFRTASKDYDRPDIPVEQRGFNFVLKTPTTLQSTAAEDQSMEEDSGFGSDEESSQTASGPAGVPVIPMIAVSNISFYDALKQVCELVGYKFKVQGSIIIVMHKNASTDEMVTRSYPVLSSFMDRMTSASSDMKEMKSSGFGGGSSRLGGDEESEGNQEKDWKEFFSLLGVQWPEGSSIMYIKTIGKLRVKNTYENLAELEQALTEMNADPKLIEIEARFVEVCQEDLNSLGFEWILNGDYALGLNRHLGKVLGINPGTFTAGSSSPGTTDKDNNGDREDFNGQQTSNKSDQNTIDENVSNTIKNGFTGGTSGTKGPWSRDTTAGAKRNLGINAFGDGTDYSNGNRYLSTEGNHISGQSKSTNDRFLKVNAFLGSADLSMILHMLSQRSDTDLLSAPKVLTRPGEEAVIKVVTEYIYPTDYDVQLQSSSSSSSGSSGSSQSAILAVVEPQSFTMREVGVILDVTPTLTDDGNLIDLKLNTQVVDEPTWKNYGMRIPFTGNASSLQSFEGIGDIMSGLSDIFAIIGTNLTASIKAVFAAQATDAATTALENLTSQSSADNITYYDAPMEQPFFHVRSIDSNVSVYPGATIVMGGLITEARKAMDDKVPFLGDIPFIGRFFRSHSEWTSKRNLLIFVTTRLVDVQGREVALGAIEDKNANVKPAPKVAK